MKNYFLFFIVFWFNFIDIFSSAGSLDTTFNSTGIAVTNVGQVTGTSDIAQAMAIDVNGKFVIAGTNGIDFAVARYTAAGVLDATFGTGGKVTTDLGGAADIAYGVAIDGNNNIIVAGTDGTNFAVARYTSTGVLDTSFGTGGKTITQIGVSTANVVYGVAIDTSNNVVVVGTTGVDFVVARYLGMGVSAGLLDTTFGSGVGYVTTNIGTTDIAYALAIQSDGKIVVAGRSANDYAVARYLTNGKLDTVANGGTGFGNVVPASAVGYVVTNISGADIAYAVALQADGKIVAAGKSGADLSLARYTTAGVLDTTFNVTGKVTTNVSGTDIAYGVKIQPSNQYIVVCGKSSNNFSVVRYTTTGALDVTFGGTGKVVTDMGGTDAAYALAITSGGNITLAGTNNSDFVVAQYTTLGLLNNVGFGVPNGYVVTDIGMGSTDVANSCVIQPDGKIVTVGSSANNITLLRYTINGALDSTFGTGGIVTTIVSSASIAYGVALQSNGYIVVVGAGANAGTNPNKFIVVRYTPTGLLDTTFNASGTPGYTITNVGGTSIAYGVVIQPDGKIVVAGKSGTNFAVARYLTNGTLDTVVNGGSGFGPGGTAPGYVTTNLGSTDIGYGVALTSAGKIVVGGVSGSNFAVAQYTSAGILDTGNFNGASGYVTTAIGTTSTGYAVAINSSGKIIVAGVTTTAAHNNFAVSQYTSAGVLDTSSFGSGVGYVITDFSGDDTGYNLALQSNGYIVVAGISAGNIALVRYTDLGILDSGFGSAGKVTTELVSGKASGAVGLFLQPNGRIVVSATTSSLAGDFVTLRYFGDMAGMLDEKFNSHGLIPGCLNLHIDLGTTQLSYGQAKQIEFSMTNNIYYIAVDDGINTQITSINGLDDTQIADFGQGGVITIVGKSDVADLFLDGTGALNISGGSGASGLQAGWIYRYNATDGTLISAFTPTTFLDVSTVVGQQATTRILVAGKKGNSGAIIAYNSITGALDTTFGQTANPGFYYTGVNSIINDMKIDSLNNIYIMFNDASNNATTQKISLNGGMIGNPVWTGNSVVANSMISSNNNLVLVLDSNGNTSGVIICAVDTTTPQIVVKQYNYITGTTLTTLNITNAMTGFTIPVITALSIDVNNKLLLCGYNNVSGVDTTFLARVTANLSGLDATFNPSGIVPGIQSYIIPVAGADRAWNDVVITAEGRIEVVGYVNVSGNNVPYLARFYGDPFASQQSNVLPIGSEGTLDLTFNPLNGTFNLNLLNHLLLDSTLSNTMLTLSTDFAYIGFDNEVNASYLIRMQHSGEDLDILYNPTALYGMPVGFAEKAPQGVVSIMIDGNARILLTGTDSGGGWVQRYVAGDSGAIDSSFGVAGVISGQMSNCAMTVQQTLGRFLVAGTRNGNGVLRAYTISGVLDTTFNATGTIPGEYNTGVANGLYNLVADSFDRLYIAYKNGSNVDIVRLASNGYLDASFSNGTGIISSAIINADNAAQVRIVLDSVGNVVAAAHINDGSNKIAVVAWDTTGAILIYPQLNISYFTAPVLTSLVAKTSGKVLLGGYQSGNNPMWVTQITTTGVLDSSYGNGIFPGVLLFDVSGSAQTSRVLQGLSVRYDGELSEVGYELALGIKTPYAARSYSSPYQQAIPIAPLAVPVGKIDQTLGKSGVPIHIVRMFQQFKKYKKEVFDVRNKKGGLRSITVNGITFFASPDADAACNQVAQAVAMQDVDTYVIALDGATASGGQSKIFINEFDVNGAVDTSFNGTGQAQVPHYYENEYVRDMVTFTTPAGIHKAILAGYANNATLGKTNAVLWQYNLTSVGLDTSFGGFNGDPAGIVFGGGQQAHVVGQQSIGRIIVSGLDQSGNGLMRGYTSAGKLDTSFGARNSGFFSQGTTGIYTHAIDTQNRIVIAYNDGSNNVAVARILADGSGLDSSFGTGGLVTDKISGISGNSNMKVTLDSSNQVIVAAVTNSGVDTVLKRYTNAGIIDITLTVTSANLGGITSLTLARLLSNTNGNLVAVGWDNTTNDQLIIFQTAPDLTSLDAGFNDTGTPGYLKYIVSTGLSQVANDALIHPDGRIIVVGSEV